MEDLKNIECGSLEWKKISAESLNLDYAIILKRSSADTLLRQLEDVLQYFTGDLTKVKVFGKWHAVPRQQVAYGDPGISYKFSGLTVPALPWPLPLEIIRNKLIQLTGHRFDFVLVNRYRDGNDHIGEHRDDEVELDPTAPIASFSLGQKRTFVLKHRDARKRGPEKRDIPSVKLDLEHGSLLLMNPPTNQIWYHSLPTRKTALGRSYKYIMYATKTPSLRIVHSDLKCKSGCGFYGNAQWQGYCSKCHREQVHRQRRTEKANSSQAQPNTSPSLQREHQVLERQPKASPVAGFTKFEEKKSRQSDSLKKTKLLNVFRKTSNAKDVGNNDRESRDRGPSELVIPTNSLKMQRQDFHQSFPNLDSVIERDTRKHVEVLISRISKQYQSKTVDELSDMTQNFYQLFAQRMDTNPHYSEVDAETRELLLDFVEKYAMTYLHGIFFSPGSCDDERKDAQIHARIRKLCWVSPQHLDCRIDQGNARVRDLLYAAISELVAMDSVLSPGSKLAHVVGCCRGVVGVVGAAGGGPASADELLPALIFTVLKANPPRLTSNINFVTRFCNAARLMTGEGGYYFTNLCCAVSFIENLTPESLNMTKDDFDGYMSLPSIVGGGSWVAALSLCEGLHEIQDQIKDLQELERRTITIDNMTKDLEEQVETFQDEIMKKVADVLARTPLDINAKKYTPPATQEAETAVLIEPVTPDEIQNPSSFVQDDVNVKKNDKSVDIFDTCTDDNTVPLIVSAPMPTNMENIFPTDFGQGISEKIHLPPNSLVNLTTALDNPPISTLKTISSAEFLSPSPLFGYGCFDTQSLDELATPDDFGSEQFLNRLTNVNYDIDLSDLSAENSAAEDLPILPNDNDKMKQHDPFSPEGLTMTEHAQAWQAMQAESLKPSENLNFYTPMMQTQIQDEAASILDANDSPTTDCLLPSPIKPLNTSYQDSYK